jgi:hypothetical protein
VLTPNSIFEPLSYAHCYLLILEPESPAESLVYLGADLSRAELEKRFGEALLDYVAEARRRTPPAPATRPARQSWWARLLRRPAPLQLPPAPRTNFVATLLETTGTEMRVLSTHLDDAAAFPEAA